MRGLLKNEIQEILLRFDQCFGQFHQACPDYIRSEFLELLKTVEIQTKI